MADEPNPPGFPVYDPNHWSYVTEQITASGGLCLPITSYYSFGLADLWKPVGWPRRFHLFPRYDAARGWINEWRGRMSTAFDVLRDRHDCGDGW